MRLVARLARRFWYLLNRRRLERDLEREMASHRAMMDDPRGFGNPIRLREQNADVWGWTWIDDLRQDLRYAFRLLRRAPAFAAAAIATLALGIGASTAIFSVAYGVSLRPLPYPQPERLVRIYEAHAASGRLRHEVSVGTFDEWRRRAKTIESLALMEDVRVSHLADANEQPVTSLAVTPAFFKTLGVAPMLGPGFKTEDEYRKQRSDEVVLSYGAWQRLFGGRPDVIGHSMAFWRDDDRWLVVGVMPSTFSFGPAVDVWRPEIIPLRIGPGLRNLRQDDVVARLGRGVTFEQARADLEAITEGLKREFPAANAGWGVTLEPLHAAFIGDFGHATWLLLAAVAVVLLVACINVAGLLLARAIARERETAVREAIGAAPWRLVRQWLTEAALLGVLGTAGGLVLAWSGTRALKAASPPGIPRLDTIVLDLPVLTVSSICALIAVAVIGFVPLRHRAKSARRDRARSGLMLAQCSGAVALVVLSLMLTRSVIRLVSLDLGWNAAGIMSLNIVPEVQGRTLDRHLEWSDRLLAELRARPEVAAAALTTQVPLSTTLSYTDVFAEGRRDAGSEDARWSGVRHAVTDGYFELMGIRLIRGRTFDPSDRFAAAQFVPGAKNDRGVVIVSESVARTLWPGQSALGRAIRTPNIDNVAWREVVGVVEDIQFHAVGEAPALHLFVPYSQTPIPAVRLLVRGRDRDTVLDAAIQAAAQAAAPGTRIDQVSSLDALVSRATAQPRFTARTVAAFGLLALVLAAVGIYGTLSYIVGARMREIAIRLSLGASRGVIVPDVLRRGLTPVLVGGVIGVFIAAVIARTFETLLFQIEPLDAVSFAIGAALLLCAALAAALAPAIRVLRVNPATALRAE